MGGRRLCINLRLSQTRKGCSQCAAGFRMSGCSLGIVSTPIWFVLLHTQVEEKRRDLFTLFKNLAKIAFEESRAFVSALLQVGW